MMEKQKMQVLIVKNFIFDLRKRLIGGLHKYALKRQMFLSHNHALKKGVLRTKILLYNGIAMEIIYMERT